MKPTGPTIETYTHINPSPLCCPPSSLFFSHGSLSLSSSIARSINFLNVTGSPELLSTTRVPIYQHPAGRPRGREGRCPFRPFSRLYIVIHFFSLSFGIGRNRSAGCERDSKHMDRELAGLSPPVYQPFKESKPFIPKTVLYDRLVIIGTDGHKSLLQFNIIVFCRGQDAALRRVLL